MKVYGSIVDAWEGWMFFHVLSLCEFGVRVKWKVKLMSHDRHQTSSMTKRIPFLIPLLKGMKWITPPAFLSHWILCRLVENSFQFQSLSKKGLIFRIAHDTVPLYSCLTVQLLKRKWLQLQRQFERFQKVTHKSECWWISLVALHIGMLTVRLLSFLFDDILITNAVSPAVEPFSFPGDLVSGKRAGVACVVSAGDPPIKIKWLKNGLPLDKSLSAVTSTTDFTSFLSFPHGVSRSHNGEYTCQAENSAATASFSAPMVVQGMSNPSLLLFSRNF